MNNIPDVISKTIDVLSDKFGATGIHLWEVLVRQSYIYGFYSIFISLIILVLSIYVFPKWSKKIIKDDWDSCAWFPFAIVFTIALIFILGYGYDAISHISNPEYGAIQSIIDRGI